MVQTTSAPTTRIGDYSSERVEALSKSRGEPDWLTRQRVRAWRIFESSPMPSTQEIWRKVDLTRLGIDDFALTSGSPSPARTPASEANNGVLYTRDAGLAEQSLDPDLAAKGVIFTTLQDAVRDHPDIVKLYLESALPAEGSKFDALNSALWTGGTFLYVPRDVEAVLPLRAISHVTRARRTPEGALTAVRIVCGDSLAVVDGTRAYPGNANDPTDGVLVQLRSECLRPTRSICSANRCAEMSDPDGREVGRYRRG